MAPHTVKNGREQAHGRLQVILFQEAMAGNPAALIFKCVIALGWLSASRLPGAKHVRNPASGRATIFRQQMAAFVAAHAQLFVVGS
jgi:hypothetical protein